MSIMDMTGAPDGVSLAFYKGKGGTLKDQAYDRAIRTWTGKFLFTPAKYSHVCVVFGGPAIEAWEASPRWGGVHQRDLIGAPDLDWKPGHWDFIVVPVRYRSQMLGRAEALEDHPYDWQGIWLSMAFRLGRHAPEAWFCSEYAAMLLAVGGADGFEMDPRTWLIHPQGLADKLLALKLQLIEG